MTDNRYAPPSATVADIESVPEALPRPRHVKIGVTLLCLELAIGVPQFVTQIFSSPQRDTDGMMFWTYLVGLIVSLVFLALSVLFTFKAWKGRNWARIAYLAFLIFGIGMTVAGAVANYALTAEFAMLELTWANVAFLGGTLLDVVGVGLLFSPSSSAWYRELKAARAEGQRIG